MRNSDNKSDLVFVTAIYGREILPMLAPHLYSISQCHPGSEILVMWQDIPQSEIELFSKAFPQCRFHEVEETIEGSEHQRISRKLHCWQIGCGLYPDKTLCFIDCDTVMVRPVTEFISDDFDVLFTWKDEPFPLNVGVMIANNGRRSYPFFEKWASHAEEIVSDEQALAFARRISGAADQHALRQMIGFVNYKELIVRQIAGTGFRFKGVPCEFLNETNSAPITDNTHIIHYKGGWHPIILHGKDFSKNRPEPASREMYQYWLKTEKEAHSFICKSVLRSAVQKYAETFKDSVGSYESRGVLHSEMLAACSACDELDVDLIIESGRARGQSTLTFAKYFQDKGADIISIDYKDNHYFNEEDDEYACSRLTPYENVEVMYGDGCRIIPEIVKYHTGKRIAVFLDGPKGLRAVELIKELIDNNANVAVAFLHDTMKGTPQREELEHSFKRVFFTDDEEYVACFSEFDNGCREDGHWRPYWNRNYGTIDSYGPTLTVILPEASEMRIGSLQPV